MKPLTLEEVVAAMQGSCDRPIPPISVTRVTTDSRDVHPGDLFIAIRGEKFDGHDFVPQASEAGARAAVVRNDYTHSALSTQHSALIRVDDPIEALGRLARYYRRSIMPGSMTVVAVTGSNGKTTTKSMIAHILSGRWHGKASIKSFNNNIGVPLTLLSAEPTESFVICEVGTNAPGEIAALASIIEPDVAVLTGIAEAHLEKLGSLQGIAEEKLFLLSHLQPSGCAVINADNEIVRWMLQRDRRYSAIKQVTFGEWAEADLRLTNVQNVETSKRRNVKTADSGRVASSEWRVASDAANGMNSRLATRNSQPVLHFTINDRFHYRLNVPGRHNAWNALAAIGVARRFGMDHPEIAERLATFTLPTMRLECEQVNGLTLINDAYNANPASLAAAVNVLNETPANARRVLIVGDMRELGAASESLHQKAAEHIAGTDINVVIAIGQHAKLVTQTIQWTADGKIETHAYATTELAKRRLATHLQATDTILLKGSRALGLETLIETIRSWAGRTKKLQKANHVIMKKRAPLRVAAKQVF